MLLITSILKNKVIRNFISLALIQLTNFIIPILTFPYVIKIVGLSHFGIITAILSSIIFFQNVVDYGFNISATREVAQNKNNELLLNNIVNSIYSTKFLLLIICFVFYLIFVCLYKIGQENFLAFILGFSMVVGNALLPTWFFQGIERMDFLTLLNVISKIFFNGMIFLVIKDSNDYQWVCLLYGLGNVVSGLIGTLYLFKSKNYTLKFIPLSKIIKTLSEGRFIFYSNLSISLYSNSTSLILSYFVTPYILGIYGIFERIILLYRHLLSVYSNSIYPRVCQLSLSGTQPLYQFFRTYYLPFFILIVVLSLIGMLFAKIIINYFIPNDLLYYKYLQLLLLTPIVICVNIPFYQILIAKNMQKIYQKIYTSACVFGIPMVIVMTYKFDLIGALIGIIIIESYVTFSFLSHFYTKIIQFLNTKKL